MIFIETALFSSLLPRHLSDDEYSEFQHYLAKQPDVGDIIRGSGGIRKVRWAKRGRGKSGGVRMIYYWKKTHDQIYMLTIYSKNEQENIDSKTLQRIAKELEELT
jgi:hypothetical protein